MSDIPASVQQPANAITAIKTFMVTFLQCSFSASSSSRLMHSTGAAFNISIALTNIRSHAVPTVNLYFEHNDRLKRNQQKDKPCFTKNKG